MSIKGKRLLYIGIALFIYLTFISFPTYIFTNDLYVLRGVELGLRAGYLIFIILFSIFTKIAQTYTGKTRFKNLFLLLPLFFVSFINIFYLAVMRTQFDNPFATIFTSDGVDVYNLLKLLTIIVTVVEEELLFRYIIQRNLTFGHKLVRITVTAAIFAACHFFFMLYDGLGTINPLDLFEIIFVFGIGIILGFLYEYTNNIIVPMTFNLIYSLCNYMLYKVSISNTTNWQYYLTISLFAVGAAGYLLIFYFLMLKRENR